MRWKSLDDLLRAIGVLGLVAIAWYTDIYHCMEGYVDMVTMVIMSDA